MLSDGNILQLIIKCDINYSGIPCQVETPDIIPEGDIYVELVNDKPLFATREGLYSFLPGQERFVPDTTFGKELDDVLVIGVKV